MRAPGKNITVVWSGIVLAVALTGAPVRAEPVTLTGKTPDFYKRPNAVALAVNNASKKFAESCGKFYQTELKLVSHRCVPREKDSDWVQCEVTLACEPVARKCGPMFCGTDKKIIEEIINSK